MTEAEWLACQNPGRMLLWSENKVSLRKLRLFACACCHRIGRLLTDDRLRGMVEVAEGIAEGVVPATGQVFTATQQAAFDALNATKEAAARLAARAVIEAAFPVWSAHFALRVAMTVKEAQYAADRIPRRLEEQAQAALVREIVGPLPFRSIPLDPSWLGWDDGVLHRMAQARYDQRDIERMPELADALGEAGCTNADILAHCRAPGSHARGCWVLDLILGRE